jgi:glycosyltransferase involved in cell wall biosynthesis
MGRALDRWQYGAHTQHRLVPHGHFGNLASGSVDRAAVEASLGLRPGVLRLGIVGAPRPAKRVDVAMEAVVACGRDDIELLVLSLRPGEPVPDDPRIVALPYETVPRSDYNARLAAIDVLVFPFDDGDMLATGTVGDAVGYGLPSLVSDWGFLDAYLGDAGIPYGRTASDLAARIDSLTAAELNSARRAALGLRERYDWARVAELHLQVLEELGTEKL